MRRRRSEEKQVKEREGGHMEEEKGNRMRRRRSRRRIKEPRLGLLPLATRWSSRVPRRRPLSITGVANWINLVGRGGRIMRDITHSGDARLWSERAHSCHHSYSLHSLHSFLILTAAPHTLTFSCPQSPSSQLVLTAALTTAPAAAPHNCPSRPPLTLPHLISGAACCMRVLP